MKTTTYNIADDLATLTSRSFFLTGKAGTGKTTFLKQLRKTTAKQMAVVAPTGVAAINAGGVTIHSFFQLPFTPFVPTPEGRLNLTRKIKMSGRKRKVLQELELLVIDEISMVRADVLDEIDTVLRHFRFRHNEPFGGVQLICIGDLYQLAPVAVPEEWQVLEPYYKTPFFFDSQVIRQHPLLYVEFDKIFRQSDEKFIRILNAVRDNNLTDTDLQLLQKQHNPSFDISQHPDYILLTTHNAKADRVNNQEMARLKSKEHTYTAEIKGEFPEKNFPNNAELILKKGAKVMFIANDTASPRKYFNGKIGTISQIEDEHIFVHCEDEAEDIEVKQEEWKNIRYNVNPTTKQIEEKELGSFKQYPLRLAWAITIHKSQGLTFDKVAVDIEAAFASGQVYVALSRCRSLEGIALLSNLNRNSLSVDHDVVDYTARKTDAEQLQQQLEIDKSQYNQVVVLSIFNFSFSFGQAKELKTFIGSEADLFNRKARAFITKVEEAINKLYTVSGKFQRQISVLYAENNSEKLAERIAAASDYFTQELERILKILQSSDVKSSDFETATEYNFCLQSIYDDLSFKNFIIKNIRKDFSTEHYLDIKNKFSVPKLGIKTYKTSLKDDKEKEPKKSTYEITLEMYQQGKSIAEIAEERGYVENTIQGHISRFIKEGKISVYDFVTKEQIESTREFFEAGGGLKDVYEALEGNLSYGDLRIIQAGIDYEKKH